MMMMIYICVCVCVYSHGCVCISFIITDIISSSNHPNFFAQSARAVEDADCFSTEG